jgi:ADP-ribose pyrophosphatase
MKWEIIDKKIHHEGFFRMEQYRLRHELFAGGHVEIERELFVRSDTVAVLPYDPAQDAVVLIEQFRVGALERAEGPWLREIVAGIIEPSESVEEVATRECVEETRCEPRELLPITRYYVSPGGTCERMTVFCAVVDATEAGVLAGVDDQEDIRIEVVPVEQAFRWTDEGLVDSAPPIIALQWLRLNRSRLRERWQLQQLDASDDGM